MGCDRCHDKVVFVPAQLVKKTNKKYLDLDTPGFGHISAKGNGRKKLMERKENIGLQIPGSKSWTHISEKGIGGKITGASGGLKLR